MKNHLIIMKNRNRNKNIKATNKKNHQKQVNDIMMIMNIQEIKDIIEEVKLLYIKIKLGSSSEVSQKSYEYRKKRQESVDSDKYKNNKYYSGFQFERRYPKVYKYDYESTKILIINQNQQKYWKVKIDLVPDKEINQIVVIVIREDRNQHINLKNTVANINENKIYILLWIKLSQKYFLFQEVKSKKNIITSGPGAGKGT